MVPLMMKANLHLKMSNRSRFCVLLLNGRQYGPRNFRTISGMLRLHHCIRSKWSSHYAIKNAVLLAYSGYFSVQCFWVHCMIGPPYLSETGDECGQGLGVIFLQVSSFCV